MKFNMYKGTEKHIYENFCLLLCPYMSMCFLRIFFRSSNRRKNEKSAPIGITCQMFSTLRVGVVKVWYKIPKKDYLPEVKIPIYQFITGMS